MSEERSQRPGGITALGIINLAGFAISLIAMLVAVYHLIAHKVLSNGKYPDMTSFYLIEGLNAGICLLLIGTGIGLMTCRKFLGRYLSSILCFVSIAKGVAVVTMAPSNFDLFLVALVVWPIVTAVLVNTVFTEDLIR